MSTKRAHFRSLLPLLWLSACVHPGYRQEPPGFGTAPATGERVRVVELYPGVIATIVAPARLDTSQRIDLILYALPNGNSTAETIGRAPADGVGWRYDIQHIGAQTRALRIHGMPQAVVAYLEADTRSWPAWRQQLGYERANPRIVEMVDQLRSVIGNSSQLAVTLTGHSGGGSFTWGFIDGQDSLPNWLVRIAFLDSNYSFEQRHGDKIEAWLDRSPDNRLVVLGYDDREITLDGRKVVSDSGGTWRASHRMIDRLVQSFPLVQDRLGEFLRYRNAQVEILLHPNPDNRILHTELIGEMNGYLYAMRSGRTARLGDESVLKPVRAYAALIRGAMPVPPPAPPRISIRAPNAPTGSAFIASIAALGRDEREAAIRAQLFAGNIPSHLRQFRTVVAEVAGADGLRHAVSYEVMPDYLAIGSDGDFVRMPMTPHTAQAFCDAFGFVLPTRKMVGDIWAAAAVKLDPRPLTESRESPLTFRQHHEIIEQQIGRTKRGALVAGHKKDVVVTNRLQERADRVAIFGWHHVTGEPIQPLYTGHVDWYVDYSHGVRPVRRTMRVDGRVRLFEQILADSLLAPLLSDEGTIAVARYERAIRR